MYPNSYTFIFKPTPTTMSALPGNFEVRTTGVFSVICLKSEAKFAAAPKAVVKAAPKKAKKEESDDDLDDLFGDDDEEEDDFDTMLAKKIAADKDLQARKY